MDTSIFNDAETAKRVADFSRDLAAAVARLELRAEVLPFLFQDEVCRDDMVVTYEACQTPVTMPNFLGRGPSLRTLCSAEG